MLLYCSGYLRQGMAETICPGEYAANGMQDRFGCEYAALTVRAGTRRRQINTADVCYASGTAFSRCYDIEIVDRISGDTHGGNPVSDHARRGREGCSGVRGCGDGMKHYSVILIWFQEG